MTTATDTSAPADEPTTSKPRPSRLNQALAWVGIAAGGLFIVAAIFFSGFGLSWSLDGHWGGHPAPMDCCDKMKPGEQMKPGAMMGPEGQMKPGGMMPGMTMAPGGMMGPSPQSPTTATPSTPRP